MAINMNRRGFCKSMLAFAGITNLPACNLLKDKQFASAFNTFGNKHFIAKLDENGAIVTQVKSPIEVMIWLKYQIKKIVYLHLHDALEI